MKTVYTVSVVLRGWVCVWQHPSVWVRCELRPLICLDYDILLAWYLGDVAWWPDWTRLPAVRTALMMPLCCGRAGHRRRRCAWRVGSGGNWAAFAGSLCNKDHQRMMVDPMFMIVQSLRSFLTAVKTTAVAPIAVIFTCVYLDIPKITWIYL